MEYIYICPKCGALYGGEDENGKICEECGFNISYSGYTDKEWYSMSSDERREFRKLVQDGKNRADILTETQSLGLKNREIELRNREIEFKKQEYANSFNEYYEYDVVTVINENHGRIDKENMMRILSEHARQGWRLHSTYSNELGKNAIRILGFGINSTACEDVLIFERRIEKLPD